MITGLENKISYRDTIDSGGKRAVGDGTRSFFFSTFDTHGARSRGKILNLLSNYIMMIIQVLSFFLLPFSYRDLCKLTLSDKADVPTKPWHMPKAEVEFVRI
jgi:hypothetical protein